MIKKSQDCIDQSIIRDQYINQHLICGICLQVMTAPCQVVCGQNTLHIFGHNCIEKWAIKKGQKLCPLCRVNEKLSAQSKQLKVECLNCQTIITLGQYYHHLQGCSKHLLFVYEKLKTICIKEKQILQQQITPHLKGQHQNIYIQHVNNWEWLAYDRRDWKWWWWASMPWWNNQTCIKCNELWHKYQDQVEIVEQQRVAIIQELNLNNHYTGEAIKDMK